MDLFISPVAIVVSSRVRQILEALEIGDTGFLPVEVRGTDGMPEGDKTWSILKFCNRVPTLGPADNITLLDLDDGDVAFPYLEDIKRPIPVLRSVDRKGLDIWADPKAAKSLFVSNRLLDAFKAAGLSDIWSPFGVAAIA